MLLCGCTAGVQGSLWLEDTTSCWIFLNSTSKFSSSCLVSKSCSLFSSLEKRQRRKWCKSDINGGKEMWSQAGRLKTQNSRVVQCRSRQINTSKTSLPSPLCWSYSGQGPMRYKYSFLATRKQFKRVSKQNSQKAKVKQPKVSILELCSSIPKKGERLCETSTHFCKWYTPKKSHGSCFNEPVAKQGKYEGKQLHLCAALCSSEHLMIFLIPAFCGVMCILQGPTWSTNPSTVTAETALELTTFLNVSLFHDWNFKIIWQTVDHHRWTHEYMQTHKHSPVHY